MPSSSEQAETPPEGRLAVCAATDEADNMDKDMHVVTLTFQVTVPSAADARLLAQDLDGQGSGPRARALESGLAEHLKRYTLVPSEDIGEVGLTGVVYED